MVTDERAVAVQIEKERDELINCEYGAISNPSVADGEFVGTGERVSLDMSKAVHSDEQLHEQESSKPRGEGNLKSRTQEARNWTPHDGEGEEE